MCEPASYFEQEAAAISRARGLGSPVTSNPCVGVNHLSLLFPTATHALVCGVACFSTCQLSAFILSLNFPQDIMQKGRKK